MDNQTPVSRIHALKSITLSSCLLASFNLVAFERDHDAHQHGHSSLAIAIENNTIQLEFTSPAINIVGFEHKPSSKEDKEKIEEAEHVLKNATSLFIINPETDCRLSFNAIESALIEEHEEDHHDHDSTHEEEHHKDHHESEHEEDNHSEFKAEYRFECEKIAELKSIDVKLIEAFPTIEEIETQLLTKQKQTLIELDKKQQRLEF